MSANLRVLQAGITQFGTDAIVNGANASLLGAGAVDGAIHRAAGPELLTGCRLLQGCHTSAAKVTKGHHQKARHLIHTTGPSGGAAKPAKRTRSAPAARAHPESGLQSIAFPCISREADAARYQTLIAL